MQRAKLIEEINNAIDRHDFEQVLLSFDALIEIDGESINLLDYKCDLLRQLGRYEEALALIPKLEILSVRKSPWNYLKAAEIYMQLGDHAEALQYIEKAITERAFRRIVVFNSPVYDPLRQDADFTRLVAKAQENIGLGKPVKDFSITLLDGGQRTLSSLQGRVVLIDFWGTNCPPCVKEIPYLKTLYAELHPQGFEILGISMDEDREKLEAFVTENDLRWKIACSGKGWLDETVQLYQVNAQPSLWLVDQQGILRHFDLRGEALGNAVRALLREARSKLIKSQLG
jgi:peroxiredoxin